MLEKIRFNDKDTLYVLGDVIDHSSKPIEVLCDMSERANVIPIVGNHEYVAMTVLKQLLPLMNADGFIKSPPNDLAVDMKQRLSSLCETDGVGENRRYSFDFIIETLKAIRCETVQFMSAHSFIISTPNEEQSQFINLLGIAL
jgi:predicted MPP superfamily phosphohydrolase